MEANLYKKLYRLEKAKNTLNEVINLSIETSKSGAAKGFLALGEIYEMENDFKQAFENYNKAAEYAQNKEDERILLSEI